MHGQWKRAAIAKTCLVQAGSFVRDLIYICIYLHSLQSLKIKALTPEFNAESE
jgi:hypothetical protein